MSAHFKSMHPRSYMADGKLRDTSKPRSRRKIERMIAGLEGHIDKNPRDDAARKRLATARQRLKGLS